jgi:hypothetical protein
MVYSNRTVCWLLLLSSCGVPQRDYDSLKKENEQLKIELDEIKNGADRLLNEARHFIEGKEYRGAKNKLEKLIDKHPESPQATEAKDLVLTVNKLIASEERLREKERVEREKAEKQRMALEEKAEKERLTSLTKSLKTKYDDVKGISWYYDKRTPAYTNYNSFHLYMGKEKSGRPWLRFRIQYAADDWLFIESYIVKTDTRSHTIETTYGEVETDHGSSEIWEWYDVPMSNELYYVVVDVIDSKAAKLRCNGRQYYKDRTITASEKQGLQNILDAYQALGGQLDFD